MSGCPPRPCHPERAGGGGKSLQDLRLRAVAWRVHRPRLHQDRGGQGPGQVDGAWVSPGHGGLSMTRRLVTILLSRSTPPSLTCGVTACWCGSWSPSERCHTPGWGRSLSYPCSNPDTGWTDRSAVPAICELSSIFLYSSSFLFPVTDTNSCWIAGTCLRVEGQDSRRSKRTWRSGFCRAQIIFIWKTKILLSHPQLKLLILDPDTGLERI